MKSRPIPFVLAASDHGPMIVNHLDYHTMVSGLTYGVGHQILAKGAYDPEEIVHVKGILNSLRVHRGDVLCALDCGANIGVHTIEMARHLGPKSQVWAIEAQERLFYALCGNIALNNLLNASAINAAVSDVNGYMMVPRPDYFRPASFGSVEMRKGPTTEYVGQSISYADKDMTRIPSIRIDSLNLARLDFLKIDVEGMEIAALQGASESISEFRPTILVEWIKTDKQALMEFFASRNYDLASFGANLLATPKDPLVT